MNVVSHTANSVLTRQKIGERLKLSAKMIEDSAYDLAGDFDTRVVSQLILCAAELERLIGRHFDEGDAAAPHEDIADQPVSPTVDPS